MQKQRSRIISMISALALIMLLATLLPKGTAASGSENKAKSRVLVPPPDGKKIPVAFVLMEGATMIDFAGPWEVFFDTKVGSGDKQVNPFELFTVSESKQPIHIEGGMAIVPDYSFADAPPASIVLVPAERGSPKLLEWLRSSAKQTDVLMSVCVGAFHLGRAGLLDGKQATTHHEFYDQFQKEFPKVTLIKGQRYVQSDDVIYTAGGLTSGIDLALHIVEKYYGHDVALKTADYMEYQSKGWIE